MSAPEVITFGAIGTAGLGVLAAAGAMGVGLVFLQAALAKLRHRELLSGVIANYRLLPEALVAPAALLLAPAEIMVGAGLLLSRHWLAALAAHEQGTWPCPVVSIYSLDDNLVVPQTSARLEGARNIESAGIGHISLPLSGRVIDLVRAELSPPGTGGA